MYNPFRKKDEKRSLTLNNSAPFMIYGGQIISNKIVINTQTALSHSDIFGVISRISSDIAGAAFDVEYPYHRVIEQPNKLQTRYSFFQSVLASMLITGDAFCTIERDKSSVPNRLELVPSDNVNMMLTDDLDILYTFTYDDGRPTATLPSKDVLHFKLMATGNESELYTGRSPLESLVPEIAIQDNSNRLTLSTLNNAISPTNILKVEKGVLDSDAKRNIRKAFEASMKTGSTVVLDQSADLKTIQINSDVANFLKNNQYTSQQIATAFGIPSSYVGLNADEQSSIEQVRGQYMSNLNTYIKPIESELAKKLAYSKTVKVKINVQDSIDSDNQLKIKNVIDLAKAKAITSEQAQKILSNYDVLGMKDIVEEDGLKNADEVEKIIE